MQKPSKLLLRLLLVAACLTTAASFFPSTPWGRHLLQSPDGSALTDAPYRPVINVTLSPWRADNTGVADASPAINAALAYWNTHGGTVFFPGGRYKLNSKLSLYSNVGTSGSGNAFNWTNSLIFQGAGSGITIFDARTITSGNVIEYVSIDGSTNLQNPEFKGFTIWSKGWNGGVDDAGTVDVTSGATGIFLGMPGVNAGTIGGAFASFEDIRLGYLSHGLVVSNWVTVVVKDKCNFQQNVNDDILLAHVDSTQLHDDIFALLGSPNLQTNHFAIRIVGTGAGGHDSGNGTICKNVEVDGRAVYGDGLVGFTWEGGDVEDPAQNIPSAFLFTNTCQAKLIAPHVVLTVPDQWPFWFENPGPSSAISIEDYSPGVSPSAGTRIYFIRWDDTYTVFFPPHISFQISPQFVNEPFFADCYYNGQWINVPEWPAVAARQGQNIGMELGGNGNTLSTINQTATTKWGGLSGYTSTNGANGVNGGWVIGPSPAFAVKTATRARASNVATITTSKPHGYTTGDTITTTGFSGSSYNVAGVLVTVVNNLTFTFPDTGVNESQTVDTGGTVTPIGLSPVTADLGLLSYSASSGANNLYIGSMQVAGPSGPDSIHFFTAAAHNGVPVDAGNVDSTGVLNWAGYIAPGHILCNSSAYFDDYIYFRSGSTVMGQFIPSTGTMVMSGGFTGNNAGLTNNLSVKAADYTLLSSDTVIELTGSHKATMPSPAAAGVLGKMFIVLCSSAGTNAIMPNASETFTGPGLSGAAKWTNSAVGHSTWLQSDGANWMVLKTDN